MALIQKHKFHWELPQAKADIEVPFNFKTYHFQDEGSCFVVLNLAIPLLVLVITSFTLNRDSTMFASINLIASFICLSFSFTYLALKSFSQLFKSGLLIFYTFILIPNFAILIHQIISFATGIQSQWMTIMQFWFQLIAQVIVIVLAFKQTFGLKDRFRLTFKFNWKWLLIVFISGVFLMWGTNVLYDLIFQNTPLGGNSNNQNGLTNILKNPASPAIKIFYIFTLLIFTVGVAPLAEELACRHAWFIGSGNRWFGLATAPIYFGYLHVQSGDVEHILSYVIAGLILSSIFNFSRGNVAYSWTVHAGINLLALILLLV